MSNICTIWLLFLIIRYLTVIWKGYYYTETIELIFFKSENSYIYMKQQYYLSLIKI